MSMRSLLIGGTLVAGVVAAVANTGPFDDHTDRDSTGEIVDAGGLGAFKIQVGDCINWPDNVVTAGGQELASVEGVPCDQLHDAQAITQFDLPGSPTFEQQAIEFQAMLGCVERWEPVIGTDFGEDGLHDMLALTPSSAGWTLVHDRSVICVVVSLSGAPLIGSMVAEG